ncbi:MAG: hypothetical protein WKF84_20670 [Pyrinomonadaceae bacterium]
MPEAFTYLRASDTPTNNTLIRKDVLSKSGLFDLAYDRGQRADGDLGMRIYLSGAVMILRSEDIRFSSSRSGRRIARAQSQSDYLCQQPSKARRAASAERHRVLPGFTLFRSASSQGNVLAENLRYAQHAWQPV